MSPPALRTIRSSRLAVTVAPTCGGKIISLQDLTTGREWLTQPQRPLVGAAGYASDFLGADMCGWDEMLPTIDACRLGAAALPDHGEVWSVPWVEQMSAPGSHRSQVHGLALPYTLTRQIAPTRTGVRLSYQLTNDGPSALPVLWAAHPQFAAQPGTRVRVPDSTVTVHDPAGGEPTNRDPSTAGKPSSQSSELHLDDTWPAQDILRDLPPGAHRKLWLHPDSAPSWAELHDSDNSGLRLSWPTRQVPYLGVLWDNQTFARQPVIALEPATGWYDALDRAVRLRRVLHLPPAHQHRWHLDLSPT